MDRRHLLFKELHKLETGTSFTVKSPALPLPLIFYT